MRINHNLASLNTYRQMSTNSTNTQRSLEKLSSGLRINKAGDDAAGLAISEKMRGQIRGLDQASRNSQDGISMIQTSEGALAETQSILQRMKELATQSANGTNTASDRGEIQKEMNQLSSEVNRIGNTTEFNTQKLLKGTTAPVVETAAATKTVTDGITGVVTGGTSDLTVNAKSIVSIASTTSVQDSSSSATGTTGAGATLSVASVAGAQSSVGLSNGMTFKSVAFNNGLNTASISIVQRSGNNVATTYDNTTNTINIGTDVNSKSLFTGSTRGELYNYINTLSAGLSADGITLDKPAATAEPLVGFPTGVIATDVTIATGTFAGGVNETRGVDSFKITDKFEEAGDTVTVGGKTFTAKLTGANASKGEFDLESIHSHAEAAATFTETTDLSTTLTSGNNEFKVAIGATDYKIDDTTLQTFVGAGKTKEDVINFIKNADTVGDGTGTKLSTVADVSLGTDGKIQIIAKTGGTSNNVVVTLTGTEKASLATWSGFNSAAATTGAVGATTGATAADQARSLRVAINANATLGARFEASGTATLTDGELVLTERTGKAVGTSLGSVTVAGAGANDKLIISNSNGQNLKTITLAQTAGDNMTVASAASGDLTINLANATASKNTAALIETAVHALGTQNGVDYTTYKFEAAGNWDTNTTGRSLASKVGTLVGGTQEVKGDYSFDVTKAFAAGDIITVKGQNFTAVSSGAIGSKGEFDVSGGDLNSQAASIRDAISLNSTLKNLYTASGSGTSVVLTEKVASGIDLKSTDLAVSATGTPGEYSVAAPELLANGAKFVLDGQEITVSNKNANVGYDNGTAIKVATSVADQTKAIADAINTNEALMSKYTASVGKDGSLVLNQDIGSTTAPVVSTKSTDKGDFTSTFQVGANSGQSMTIEVADMRSAALGITGDGSVNTVKASNGFTASYVTSANVTDGTTNKNSEFALDVSTHEKATAAIGVLDDAIAAVSAQRSQLGSYQNRLEHTINNLGTSSENLTAAESRVRDVDMAKEMMEFTKNNILSQAAQAMMAQANQQPQGVLQLLR